METDDKFVGRETVFVSIVENLAVKEGKTVERVIIEAVTAGFATVGAAKRREDIRLSTPRIICLII